MALDLPRLFRPHDPCSRCGRLHPGNRAVTVKVSGAATFEGVLCPACRAELDEFVPALRRAAA